MLEIAILVAFFKITGTYCW